MPVSKLVQYGANTVKNCSMKYKNVSTLPQGVKQWKIFKTK